MLHFHIRANFREKNTQYNIRKYFSFRKHLAEWKEASRENENIFIPYLTFNFERRRKSIFSSKCTQAHTRIVWYDAKLQMKQNLFEELDGLSRMYSKFLALTCRKLKFKYDQVFEKTDGKMDALMKLKYM